MWVRIAIVGVKMGAVLEGLGVPDRWAGGCGVWGGCEGSVGGCEAFQGIRWCKDRVEEGRAKTREGID